MKKRLKRIKKGHTGRKDLWSRKLEKENRNEGKRNVKKTHR